MIWFTATLIFSTVLLWGYSQNKSQWVNVGKISKGSVVTFDNRPLDFVKLKEQRSIICQMNDLEEFGLM